MRTPYLRTLPTAAHLLLRHRTRPICSTALQTRRGMHTLYHHHNHPLPVAPPPLSVPHQRTRISPHPCHRGLRPSTQARHRTHQTGTSGPTTFVSEYYKVDEKEIIDLLRRQGLIFKIIADEIVIKECPFCHDTKRQVSNLWKLYLHRHTGAHMCHRCGTKGSWYDFKMKLDFGEHNPILSLGKGGDTHGDAQEDVAEHTEGEHRAAASGGNASSSRRARKFPSGVEMKQYQENLSAEVYPDAVEYLLKKRGISKETAAKYGVGVGYSYFLQHEDPEAEENDEENEDESIAHQRQQQRMHLDSNGNLSMNGVRRVSELCFMFPMYTKTQNGRVKCVRQKIRSIHNKQHMKLDPMGNNRWGFFGYNLLLDMMAEYDSANAAKSVEKKDKSTMSDAMTTSAETVLPDVAPFESVVLCEGEFDAMAVYEQLNIPALSLPNGCRHLPVQLLPLLEKFKRIYLWMDDDRPGQDGADLFGNKLGKSRCYVVHSSLQDQQHMEDDFLSLDDEEEQNSNIPLHMTDPNAPKDANDALLAGIDLAQCLREAQPLRHERIISFSNLKKDILREIYGKKREIHGIQSAYFPQLVNKMMKGFRRGELTIVTGPTGIGKTTVLSQMSLDFAQQGVSTLWGSFEIKNHRLAKKMLCQMAGKDLGEKPDMQEFELYAQQFNALQMYFLNFYGSSGLDQVIDAMDYAVYVYDVQHIIIDNLQFMTSGQGSGYERFEIQDKAIEKFRSFATSRNVHITMVIHPRKVDDDNALGISSVFGSAKATQEADNVIIIQRGPFYRYFEIRKNRFDGTLGMVPYKYDKHSQKLIELTDEEVTKLENGEMTITYS